MPSSLKNIQVELLYLASHLEFGKRDPNNDDVMIQLSRQDFIKELNQIIDIANAQKTNDNEPANKLETARLKRITAELDLLKIIVTDATSDDHVAWAEKIREINKIEVSLSPTQDAERPKMIYQQISRLLESESKNQYQYKPLPGLGTPARPQENVKAENPIDEACARLEVIATKLGHGKDTLKGYKDRKELVKNGKSIQAEKKVQLVIADEIKIAIRKLPVDSKEYLTLNALYTNALEIGNNRPSGKPMNIDLIDLGEKVMTAVVELRAAQKDESILATKTGQKPTQKI